MGKAKVRTKGTGAAGAGSSRWNRREIVKPAADKARRAEDRVETELEVHQRSSVCRGYACPTCDFLEEEGETP